MSTNQPTGLDSFTAHADGVAEVVHAATVNTLQDATLSLEKQLVGPYVYNVKGYGAKGDGVVVSDGAMTSASATLASTQATFASGDVGKSVSVAGAGAAGATLYSTISTFTDSHHVVLAATAGTTVAGASVTYGTDDTTSIQNTIAAAGAAGGGNVFLPAGLYFVQTTATAGGLTWVLYNIYDNVTISGVGPSSIIRTTRAAELIYFTGAGKPGGIANWSTYLWQYTPFHQTAGLYPLAKQANTDLYPMSGTFARGAYTITLDSAPHAANFAPGDWIDIRTGEVLPSTTANADRELNQVLSVSSATITLRWPLAKGYQQEYWPGPATITHTDGVTTNASTTFTSAAGGFSASNTGQTISIAGAGVAGAALITTVTYVNATTLTLATAAGATTATASYTLGSAPVFLGSYPLLATNTTNTTGDPAPFGVQKVTSSVLQNFTVQDIQLQATSPTSPNGNALTGNCCYNLLVRNVHMVCTNSGVSIGADRASRYIGNTIYITNSYLTNGSYFISTSDGSVDILVADNTCEAPSSQGYMHVHEGSSQVRVVNNRFSAGVPSQDGDICSVRARAYDVRVIGNTFSGSGNQVAVYVDSTCTGGGFIAYNDITTPAPAAIEVDALGWHLGPNEVHGAAVNLVATDGAPLVIPGIVNGYSFVGKHATSVQTVTNGSAITLTNPIPRCISLTCSGAVTGVTISEPASIAVGTELLLINEGSGPITFAGGYTANNSNDGVPQGGFVILYYNEQGTFYVLYAGIMNPTFNNVVVSGTMQAKGTLNVSSGSILGGTQAYILGSSAGTVGLTLDTASAPTADILDLSVNGTKKSFFDKNAALTVLPVSTTTVASTALTVTATTTTGNANALTLLATGTTDNPTVAAATATGSIPVAGAAALTMIGYTANWTLTNAATTATSTTTAIGFQVLTPTLTNSASSKNDSMTQYGFYSQDISAAGTGYALTKSYGFYAASQASNTANSYAFYAAGGQSYFKSAATGQITLTLDTPSSPTVDILDINVNGAVKAAFTKNGFLSFGVSGTNVVAVSDFISNTFAGLVSAITWQGYAFKPAPTISSGTNVINGIYTLPAITWSGSAIGTLANSALKADTPTYTNSGSSATLTVTNYGVQVNNQTPSGAVTGFTTGASYALYAAAQTSPGYGIYIAGGKNYFKNNAVGDITMVVDSLTSQTADILDVSLNGVVKFGVDSTGRPIFSQTATTATVGTNGAVPSQVVGYITINIGGTAYKVPYFNT